MFIERVQDKGHHFITCRWVVTVKGSNGSNITKTRLVAKGFADQKVETSRKESLRLTFSVITFDKENYNIMDVNVAFLQVNRLKRDSGWPQSWKTRKTWTTQGI